MKCPLLYSCVFLIQWKRSNVSIIHHLNPVLGSVRPKSQTRESEFRYVTFTDTYDWCMRRISRPKDCQLVVSVSQSENCRGYESILRQFILFFLPFSCKWQRHRRISVILMSVTWIFFLLIRLNLQVGFVGLLVLVYFGTGFCTIGACVLLHILRVWLPGFSMCPCPVQGSLSKVSLTKNERKRVNEVKSRQEYT